VGLVVERRMSGKRSERGSRESSGASACREPSGGEQNLRDKTVEENMYGLFGTSSSEESSCLDKPSDLTHERLEFRRGNQSKKSQYVRKSFTFCDIYIL
jgi:hypothetical protein